jgi:hypothetical protein
MAEWCRRLQKTLNLINQNLRVSGPKSRHVADSFLYGAAMLTNDERNVRERLEAWELRIQRILAMYDRGDSLPLGLRSKVRSSYAGLKLSLEAAFEAVDSRGGRSRISAAERRFYFPALRSASAHLTCRLDAGPDAWHRSMCSALLAISAAVVLLDGSDGQAPPREWSA